MPSFDAVSKVDAHELGNAVDQAKRELDNRYDLRGTGARFELQDFLITEFAQSEYQLNQLLDILRLRLAARHIDPRCVELGEVQVNLAEARRTITIRQGIETALAKRLVAGLKEAASRSTRRSTATNCVSVARNVTICRARWRCCVNTAASCPCSSRTSATRARRPVQARGPRAQHGTPAGPANACRPGYIAAPGH